MKSHLYPALPLLLVDDEEQSLTVYDMVLRFAGLNNIVTCSDSRKVKELLASGKYEAVLLDLIMPHVNGEELLNYISEFYPEIPVIIATGVDKVETAVRCMQSRAFDYLVKPVGEIRLAASVKRAFAHRELQRENSRLKQTVLENRLESPDAFAEIDAVNPRMRSIFKYAEVIAKTDQPILITGETGVGKELLSRVLHSISGRTGEFIAVNVAGLDDNMFTDTLFGHKKVSFTSATDDRRGLVESAAGGTLFLDEIGDLSIPSQVKLLRLLQEREFFPIGQDRPARTDARIIVATNRDLKKLLREERFRNDLYFRLRTHHIEIPPLRERPDDMPVLVNRLMDEAAKSLNKEFPQFPPELMTLLRNYRFPGNVRELKSMIYDAVSQHVSGTLSLHVFKKAIQQDNKEHISFQNPEGDVAANIMVFDRLPTMAEAEYHLINEALKRAEGNQSLAAQLLGISRHTIIRRLKELKDPQDK